VKIGSIDGAKVRGITCSTYHGLSFAELPSASGDNLFYPKPKNLSFHAVSIYTTNKMDRIG
jgi:hypothetical protein